MNINFIDIIIKRENPSLKGLASFVYKFDNHLSYKDALKKLKYMKKNIRTNPPSFELLWSFAEFIKYIEIVYLYVGYPIYSITTKKGQNAFAIFKKDSYRLSLNLDPDFESIQIVINREHGSIPKTVFNIDPEFKIDNEIDRELFLVLETILVDTMIDVLKYTYKNL